MIRIIFKRILFLKDKLKVFWVVTFTEQKYSVKLLVAVMSTPSYPPDGTISTSLLASGCSRGVVQLATVATKVLTAS